MKSISAKKKLDPRKVDYRKSFACFVLAPLCIMCVGRKDIL